MGSNDPRTGNGRTGGQTPKKQQVSVKSATGTTLWKQTVAIFAKKKAAPPKAAKPVKAVRPKRNPMFDK